MARFVPFWDVFFDLYWRFSLLLCFFYSMTPLNTMELFVLCFNSVLFYGFVCLITYGCTFDTGADFHSLLRALSILMTLHKGIRLLTKTMRRVLYSKWARLHNNNIFEYKQRQIDTNVSPFVYYINVFRYMFQPSRSHHQLYSQEFGFSSWIVF
jgi:hypothetical protein